MVGVVRHCVFKGHGTGQWQTIEARVGGSKGLEAGRLSLAGSLALTIFSHKTQGLTSLTSPCGQGAVSVVDGQRSWPPVSLVGEEGRLGLDRVQLRFEISFNPGGQCWEGLLEPSWWFWMALHFCNISDFLRALAPIVWLTHRGRGCEGSRGPPPPARSTLCIHHPLPQLISVPVDGWVRSVCEAGSGTDRKGQEGAE